VRSDVVVVELAAQAVVVARLARASVPDAIAASPVVDVVARRAPAAPLIYLHAVPSESTGKSGLGLDTA
jgi:hypothetical protein